VTTSTIGSRTFLGGAERPAATRLPEGAKRTSAVRSPTMQMSPFMRQTIAAKPWNSSPAPTPPPASGFSAAPPTAYSGAYKPSFRKPPADVSLAKDATFDVTETPSLRSHTADRYMADCVTSQYKALATQSGVYTAQCSEGGVKGMADDVAVQKRSTAYRMRTRATVQKYRDFFDTRKAAIIATHGCSYEEKLVSNYPLVARAMVLGQAEANRTCVRYNQESTSEEEAAVVENYMAKCVDQQMKMRACTSGVYDVTCAEGSAKGDAESKRVNALANRFRAGHTSKLVKTQAKYDSAAYARNNFGHGCSYEDSLFELYPTVAAAMRSSAY